MLKTINKNIFEKNLNLLFLFNKEKIETINFPSSNKNFLEF